jgi:hypothetical protein
MGMPMLSKSEGPIGQTYSTRSVSWRANAPLPFSRAVRAARREVPEIRLSGAWLERIGFPKGARYLISVEREFHTIILQGSFEKARSRR